MKSIVLALTTALFLSSCAAYRAQHATGDSAAPRAARTETASPAPAPKETARPDPRLVAALTSQPLAVKQKLLISEIDRYIDELKAEGKYDCCVKPSCRQCAITAGECHCRQVIDASGPCCGECTQAWVEGKGNTAGVDREQVLAHLGCVRELYEKKVPDTVQAPAQRKDDQQ